MIKATQTVVMQAGQLPLPTPHSPLPTHHSPLTIAHSLIN